MEYRTALFNAAEIPALTDDEVVNSTTVLAERREGIVAIPTDDGLWDSADEIRVDVYYPEAPEEEPNWNLRCDVTLGTRSPGFDHPDGYWFAALVSPRAGNLWRGWRELRMPFEAFYTRGIPKGWTPVESAAITLPPGAALRNLRFVTRRVVHGPRMTDTALLARLNQSDPSLAEARRLASSAPDVALAELAGAMRREARKRRLPQFRRTAVGDRKAADAVAAGAIMGRRWPESIDWNANDLGYIEWTIRIHYLSYVEELIVAWREAPPPDARRYATAIERIVRDFIASNPIPYGVRACGAPWGHSLVVATRAYSVLIEALEVLTNAEGVSDRILVDLLKSLWEHAQYLVAFESYPPSNKTIAEARTLVAIGSAVPELEDSAFFVAEGGRRLEEDMDIQVFEDGGSYELSPGYQGAIAVWFAEAYLAARQYGHPLSKRLGKRIAGMFRWIAAFVRPDCSRPSLGDAGSLDMPIERSVRQAGEAMGVDELTWAATIGAEGDPPAFHSIALPDSGYWIMRSGWSPEDRYLVLKAGSFGRAHQHEDKLSFDLYAYGTRFIVDPGITSYLPDRFTEYYRSTAAHNTVLVDGLGQARKNREGLADWTKSARGTVHWESGDAADIAVGAYEAGYGAASTEGGAADGRGGGRTSVRGGRPIHRRAVVFVKPDYFVVFDELSGIGAHRYEALFHLLPCRAAIDSATGAIRTVRINHANIEIVPVGGVDPSIVCGQLDPVQGWISVSRDDVPAPVAVFAARGATPIRAAYVLYPYPAAQATAGISVAHEERDDSWMLTVESASRRDTISIHWGPTMRPALGR